MELTPRRERVLKHVVEEYVSTAQPVASETFVRKHVLNVSSATIRNEFSALEDNGLIGHPHTSAGRVPTDTGYRYYVEHLMGTQEIAPGEARTIAHQFHEVETDVDEWTRLASSILANALHNAAVVTPPGSATPRARRVELAPLGERVVLVAVMLESGAIRKQIVRADRSVTREELVRLSNRLTAHLNGRGEQQAGRQAERANELEHAVLNAVERILRQAEEHALVAIYYGGLGHMLAQPEFATSRKALPVIEALEHGNLLARLLSQACAGEDVRVVIGQEHPLEQMRETSAVFIRYGLADDVSGLLCVLGPTRLAYWRAVPLVRYLAQMLQVLMREKLV